MGPDSFQWCPATGQGAMGTKWSIGSPIWMWGRTSSLWGWQSTGIGCPEGLWILLLWRYSTPTWTRSCSACCRWPCFVRGVGLDDPQRSLPTPTILWFCDSVTAAQKYSYQTRCLVNSRYLWLWVILLVPPVMLAEGSGCLKIGVQNHFRCVDFPYILSVRLMWCLIYLMALTIILGVKAWLK